MPRLDWRAAFRALFGRHEPLSPKRAAARARIYGHLAGMLESAARSGPGWVDTDEMGDRLPPADRALQRREAELVAREIAALRQNLLPEDLDPRHP